MKALIVSGEPIGKGRARFGQGRTYTPERTRVEEDRIATLWKQVHGSQPLAGAIRLEITLFRPGGKRLKWPLATPDASNAAKLIEDALNLLAYTDDSQITTLVVKKRIGPAGVAIRVGPDDEALERREE